MKSYNYTKREGAPTDADQRSTGQGATALPAETSFTKAAFEWNNALLVAAEKMWGDALPYQRKLS